MCWYSCTNIYNEIYHIYNEMYTFLTNIDINLISSFQSNRRFKMKIFLVILCCISFVSCVFFEYFLFNESQTYLKVLFAADPTEGTLLEEKLNEAADIIRAEISEFKIIVPTPPTKPNRLHL